MKPTNSPWPRYALAHRKNERLSRYFPQKNYNVTESPVYWAEIGVRKRIIRHGIGGEDGGLSSGIFWVLLMSVETNACRLARSLGVGYRCVLASSDRNVCRTYGNFDRSESKTAWI